LIGLLCTICGSCNSSIHLHFFEQFGQLVFLPEFLCTTYQQLFNTTSYTCQQAADSFCRSYQQPVNRVVNAIPTRFHQAANGVINRESTGP